MYVGTVGAGFRGLVELIAVRGARRRNFNTRRRGRNSERAFRII